MTVETYDDLKQYVGSKNDFTDDLLNMGYTKGKKDGYNQALEDVRNLTFRDVTYTDSLNDRTELRELIEQLKK